MLSLLHAVCLKVLVFVFLVILRRDENKLQSFTLMIPSTFDYLLELITESSRKYDADF